MPKQINATLETILAAGIFFAMAGFYVITIYDQRPQKEEHSVNYSTPASVTTQYK